MQCPIACVNSKLCTNTVNLVTYIYNYLNIMNYQAINSH
ncbi:protein of unknown function [Vibrio tapetis subsp. tapetis]|uniref:Uncharacterized protein n=1 Tax=Vibrio tapetis subsp. tapetis TaxID=1671868 RepID=A0A2N8Z9T7_9VIBR|nr:protein of unknown function [Vibrio tapetis subsp. tapetis]